MGLPAQIFVMSWRSELLRLSSQHLSCKLGLYRQPRKSWRALRQHLTRANLQFDQSGCRSDRYFSYQEIGGGRRAFESETKLIAQKNFGPLILAYNLTLEAEWEDESLREHNGEIQRAFGASYELSPRVSVGAEMLHEVLLPAWHSSEAENNFFIGPNVSYRGNRWFATVTALAQTTRTEGEADYQVRVISGVSL